MKNLDLMGAASLRSRRRALAGLVLFAGAACTTAPAPEHIAGTGFGPSSVHSAQSLDAQGAAVLARLGIEGEYSFSARETYRVDIAAAASSLVAQHEVHPAHPQIEANSAELAKALNFAAPALDGFGPLLTAANGGWREDEEAYVHSLSGLTCAKSEMTLVSLNNDRAPAVGRDENGDVVAGFVVMPLGQIQVFDGGAGLDTACNYQSTIFGVFLTIYASRWPDVSLDEHFSESLNLMVNRFSIDEETTAIVAEPEIEEGATSTIEGETKAAAFLLEPSDGVVFKTILWLNKTGDWHVKTRLTFAMLGDDEIPLTEIFGSALFAAKLEEVDAHINSGALTQVSF